MSKKEKERAARTIRDVLSVSGRILSNSEIVRGFEVTMHPLMSRLRDYELLVKVVESHRPISLSLKVYGDTRKGAQFIL